MTEQLELVAGPTPAEIRKALATEQGRARDIAAKLGVREGQLVAARVGHGATAIAAHPDRLFPLLDSPKYSPSLFPLP